MVFTELEIHYHAYNSLPLGDVLSQLPSLPMSLCFNIFSPSTPVPQKFISETLHFKQPMDISFPACALRLAYPMA
jgi:hypothetical protein